MNYREYRIFARAAAESNRPMSAPAPSSVNVRRPTDPVLGTVAVGAMLLILGWVVTGIDFLAIFALLMALWYVRVAGTLEASERSAAADFDRRKPGALPHALATDARFNGLAATGAKGRPR